MCAIHRPKHTRRRRTHTHKTHISTQVTQTHTLIRTHTHTEHILYTTKLILDTHTQVRYDCRDGKLNFSIFFKQKYTGEVGCCAALLLGRECDCREGKTVEAMIRKISDETGVCESGVVGWVWVWVCVGGCGYNM